MNFKIDDILSLKSIKRVDGSINENFKGIEFDTRRELKGKLFVCFKGENTDGHEFIDKALEKGALGVVSTDAGKIMSYSDRTTTVHVKDNTDFLSELTHLIIGRKKTRVLAITGSSGKTTVKELLYDFLKDFLKVGKTRENFNNILGISWSYLNMDDENDFFIAECGMNHSGELSEISKMLSPELVMIVNVGHVHSGNFDSIEEITRAKLEIADSLEKDEFLIINRDYAELERQSGKYKKRITFGKSDEADIIYKIKEYRDEKTYLRIKIKEQEYELDFNGLPFISENIVAAISAVYKLGIPVEQFIQRPVDIVNNNRFQMLKVEGFDFFMDCYNSNPFSVEKIAQELSLINGNWILVLGDMKELGMSSIYWHQKIGEVIHQCLPESKLVCFGEHAVMFGEGALKAGKKIGDIYFSNTLVEIARLIRYLGSDYHIFVKGSRSMRMERLLESFSGGS